MNLKFDDIKSFSILALGNIGPQLINFLFLPLITNLYNKSSFGLFSALISLSYIITPLLSLKLELSFFNFKEKSPSLFQLTFFVVIINSMVVISTLYLLIEFNLIEFDNSNQLSNGYIYLVLISLGLTFSTLISNLFVLNGKFLYSSLLKNIEPVIFVCLAYYLSFNEQGLSIAKAVSISLFTIISIHKLWKNFHHKLKISFDSISSYPKYMVPGAVLNALTREAPLLIIITSFGFEKGGVLSLALRLVRFPISSLAVALGDYLKNYFLNSPELSHRYLFNKFLSISFYLSTVTYLFIYVLSDFILKLLFSNEWHESIDLIKTLCLLGFFQFISSSIGHLYYLLEKQKNDLYWQAIMFFCSVVSIIFLVKNCNFTDTIFWWVVLSILGYSINIILIQKIAK